MSLLLTFDNQIQPFSFSQMFIHFTFGAKGPNLPKNIIYLFIFFVIKYFFLYSISAQERKVMQK